jgi:hypothetical protein
MRKKTEPHTRKEHQASSGEKSGLIAKNQNRKQSAEAEPVLDNRSHRTSLLFTTCRSRPPGRRRHVRRLSWPARIPICGGQPRPQGRGAA